MTPDCPCHNQSPTTCPCVVVEELEITDEETAEIEQKYLRTARRLVEQ